MHDVCYVYHCVIVYVMCVTCVMVCAIASCIMCVTCIMYVMVYVMCDMHHVCNAVCNGV